MAAGRAARPALPRAETHRAGRRLFKEFEHRVLRFVKKSTRRDDEHFRVANSRRKLRKSLQPARVIH